MSTTSLPAPSPVAAVEVTGARVRVGSVGDCLTVLGSLAAEGSPVVAGLSQAQLVDLIGALERVKSVAAAAQARASMAFEASRLAERDAEVASGHPRVGSARRVRSIGAEIALARRETPSSGDRLLGMARALTTEMPCLMAALTNGMVSEYRAQLVVRETACVTADVRGIVDARLAEQYGRRSSRALEGAARRVVADLDPAGVIARMTAAAKGRRVSTRAAADGMAYLTVRGPLTEVIGAYAALQRTAAATVAAGDPPPEDSGASTSGASASGRSGGTVPSGGSIGALNTLNARPGEVPVREPRSKSQVMADTALERMSCRTPGQSTPVELVLVMTPHALAGSSSPDTATDSTGSRAGAGSGMTTDEPALVPGWGPLPAAFARTLLRQADHAWIRCIYTDESGRDLVAMDSHRRTFTGQLRRMIILRDQRCRTPWCDGLITDLDHATAHHHGGTTSMSNALGLCRSCNLTKEEPGWRHDTTRTGFEPRHRDVPHTVLITTPTGHTYESTAPPILGWGWHEPENHCTTGPSVTPWDDPRDDDTWDSAWDEAWEADLARILASDRPGPHDPYDDIDPPSLALGWHDEMP